MTMNMRDSWQRQSAGKKFLFGAIALFLIGGAGAGVGLAIAGLVGPKETETKVLVDVPKEPAAEEEATDGEEKKELEEWEWEPEETHEGREFTLKFGENARVEMPVTTDPAEAAVSAAAAMFATDFSLPADVFLNDVITRITQPSLDYIGPNGEIHTRIRVVPFEETEYYRDHPAVQMRVQMNLYRDAEYNPSYLHPWTLANSRIYETFQNMETVVWVPEPVQIVGEEEMAELRASVIPNFPKKADMEPDTPGATLTHWWVNQRVAGTEMQTADPQEFHPVHLAIWCDAPADGGICGVAYSLPTKFPKAWEKYDEVAERYSY